MTPTTPVERDRQRSSSCDYRSHRRDLSRDSWTSSTGESTSPVSPRQRRESGDDRSFRYIDRYRPAPLRYSYTSPERERRDDSRDRRSGISTLRDDNERRQSHNDENRTRRESRDDREMKENTTSSMSGTISIDGDVSDPTKCGLDWDGTNREFTQIFRGVHSTFYSFYWQDKRVSAWRTHIELKHPNHQGGVLSARDGIGQGKPLTIDTRVSDERTERVSSKDVSPPVAHEMSRSTSGGLGKPFMKRTSPAKTSKPEEPKDKRASMSEKRLQNETSSAGQRVVPSKTSKPEEPKDMRTSMSEMRLQNETSSAGPRVVPPRGQSLERLIDTPITETTPIQHVAMQHVSPPPPTPAPSGNLFAAMLAKMQSLSKPKDQEPLSILEVPQPKPITRLDPSPVAPVPSPITPLSRSPNPETQQERVEKAVDPRLRAHVTPPPPPPPPTTMSTQQVNMEAVSSALSKSATPKGPRMQFIPATMDLIITYHKKNLTPDQIHLGLTRAGFNVSVDAIVDVLEREGLLPDSRASSSGNMSVTDNLPPPPPPPPLAGLVPSTRARQTTSPMMDMSPAPLSHLSPSPAGVTVKIESPRTTFATLHSPLFSPPPPPPPPPPALPVELIIPPRLPPTSLENMSPTDRLQMWQHLRTALPAIIDLEQERIEAAKAEKERSEREQKEQDEKERKEREESGMAELLARHLREKEEEIERLRREIKLLRRGAMPVDRG